MSDWRTDLATAAATLEAVARKHAEIRLKLDNAALRLDAIGRGIAELRRDERDATNR